MLKQESIHEKLDFSKARQTIINWPNQIGIIVDKYKGEPCKGISHGVQKDAIQNGWDARVNKKKGGDWGMKFELIRSKTGKLYLSLQDFETTGLTGRVLKPDELDEDLPSNERWGRFENVAFTKRKEEEALGARGQGKFIFVGASKDYTILYDTIREDNTYRFGLRTIKGNQSPIFSWDDDEGSKKLIELTNDSFQPLKKVGTRVIIVNPIDELVADIKDGRFLENISETWWEIILKYNVSITVKYLDEKSKNRKILSIILLIFAKQEQRKKLKSMSRIKLQNSAEINLV